MAGRVIQGFFIGGRMRPPGGVRPATVQRVADSGTMRRAPGPPAPAFAGSRAPAQARLAQPQGASDSFEIDPAQLGLVRGGGMPLPQAVLARMEAAFGANFSQVRVHVGPQAARIGAVAFTTGNDLYFAPGRYQPESVQGQQLIGHELAHVIQQREGRVRAPGSGMAVVQDRMLEAEADRLGMRAAAGTAAQAESAGRVGSVRAPRLMVQRALAPVVVVVAPVLPVVPPAPVVGALPIAVAYSHNFNTKHTVANLTETTARQASNARVPKPAYNTVFRTAYLENLIATHAVGRATGNQVYESATTGHPIADVRICELRNNGNYRTLGLTLYGYRINYSISGDGHTVTLSHLETLYG